MNFVRARELAINAVPTPGATPSPSANPAEGIVSDWGVPITLATFLVLVVGGLVAYMVSRRQRARQARRVHA